MAYYSGKGARYDRAVTKKILTRSIAKNKALKQNLEAETELNRAKWENLLTELAYLEPVSEREKRATELYVQWIQGKEIKKTSPKKRGK
jgi:hypothetical protein